MVTVLPDTEAVSGSLEVKPVKLPATPPRTVGVVRENELSPKVLETSDQLNVTTEAATLTVKVSLATLYEAWFAVDGVNVAVTVETPLESREI